MNKTTKIILGGAAMIAVSAGVAGLTAYSMMPEEQSKSLAFDEVFHKAAIRGWRHWMLRRCSRWI